MSLPAVNQQELDGSLGVLPAESGRLYAVIGTSQSGTANAPATFGRVTDLLSAYGYGPLTEAAALHIDRTGRPVVVVKCAAATTTGAMGTIDDSGVTGTASTFIIHTASTFPLGDYEVRVKIVTGGTLGVAGITYRYSLDGGRNYSAVQALGTGLIIAPANTGVSFSITTAKTLIAGDIFGATTTAPAGTGSEIGDAMDALKASSVSWEILHIASPIDATIFDTVETKFAALAPLGKFRAWIGNTRFPTDAESEATYLSSLSTAFLSKSTVVGELCAGCARIVSAVPGRAFQYRLPISYVVGSREASVARHIDSADVNLGALIGVSLRDANGNPVLTLHDETINPGLDDARFTTLRTWEGLAGVYITRPRIFSAEGSDFSIMPLRRVMNLAREVTRLGLQRRLNQPVLVDKRTGFILEKEAKEIEAYINGLLSAALAPAPMASGWSFALSRTDNILSTKTLSGDTRVIPLGYVETINETVGFTNPALSITRA